MNLQLLITDADNVDFLALIQLLDADLRVRDGEEHAFYAQFNKPIGLTAVVVAYADGRAVGCGAIKAYADGVAEVKRMYVREDVRGRGVAGKVLQQLEQIASGKQFQTCILETGFKQPEAIRLYEKSGYTRIPNYEPYVEVENSVCMKKSLLG